ncbi:MAG TPA: DEAD/DEAH box helicase [Geminicoccaceae bacterium]|nr:DEAD/DEAH box helicase [Geminicoccaceae bacterium]
MTSFADLGLSAPILRAVRAESYTMPTPIQAKAIPHLLAGRDLLGCAQTGTGKTAAFALPILHRLATDVRRPGPKACRALVLTPTRELAAQIRDSFATYGRHLELSCAVVFGGVGQGQQVQSLARGVDVLVATPGRLLDLMGQGLVRLDRLEVFVLDEADRMLDMGFIHDVRKVIAALPERRQSLFFSATMLPEVVRLARSILNDPVKVEANPVASTVDLVEQRVLFVDRAAKRALLSRVLKDEAVGRALVFTRTKHGADRVVRQLAQDGVPADAIHGNKSQSARTGALERFRTGAGRVLVATDIAARGIDVDGITHVINYDLPNIPESYVHRIGRTARAGRSGVALSFCDAEERAYLRDIEALIKTPIQVVTDYPWHPASSGPPSPAPRATPPTTAPRRLRTRSRRRTKVARPAGGGHPAVRENREHAGLRPR